ncbi:MAG: radical SAM protein [Fimbriimonadales bacterium]
MKHQPSLVRKESLVPPRIERPRRPLRRSLRALWDYAVFGVDFFILRQNRPFVIGLVTNDTCNLHCAHCRVANMRRSNMSFEDIRQHLNKHYKEGARFLYLEGGEPYLWRDGTRRLQDVIDLARAIGYLRVHLYTNGTIPLTARPDFTWVSIDGLAESYERIRGISLDRVLRNLRPFKQRFAVVFVVNTVNCLEVEAFLRFVQMEFPKTGVMFFFHTPYYGFDHLFLSPDQKRQAIQTILRCKAAGLPVLNSRAALNAILTGNYFHPTNLWRVVDETGEYQCCRAIGQPEVCEHCGYSTCAEIVLSRSLNLDALRTMLRNV